MHDPMAIWAKGSHFLKGSFATDANAFTGAQKKRLGMVHFNHSSGFFPIDLFGAKPAAYAGD